MNEPEKIRMADNAPVNRYLGGSPLGVIARLVLVSILVGVVLSALGFDPWNIIQSMAAIGSGGVFGKGWLLGTQSHLDFLPESHTDFIIAVLGEEFGLVGVCLLLVLYLLVIYRGLVITAQAQM